MSLVILFNDFVKRRRLSNRLYLFKYFATLDVPLGEPILIILFYLKAGTSVVFPFQFEKSLNYWKVLSTHLWWLVTSDVVFCWRDALIMSNSFPYVLSVPMLFDVLQTGLKRKSVTCKGMCDAVARECVRRVLAAHAYLHTTALHILAELNIGKWKYGLCSESPCVIEWRDPQRNAISFSKRTHDTSLPTSLPTVSPVSPRCRRGGSWASQWSLGLCGRATHAWQV